MAETRWRCPCTFPVFARAFLRATPSVCPKMATTPMVHHEFVFRDRVGEHAELSAPSCTARTSSVFSVSCKLAPVTILTSLGLLLAQVSFIVCSGATRRKTAQNNGAFSEAAHARSAVREGAHWTRAPASYPLQRDSAFWTRARASETRLKKCRRRGERGKKGPLA